MPFHPAGAGAGSHPQNRFWETPTHRKFSGETNKVSSSAQGNLIEKQFLILQSEED